MSVYPMKFNYIAHDNQSKSKKKKSDQVSCAPRNDVLTTCKAVTLRGGQRIIAVLILPTVNIMHLCFSCISYLSFDIEIAGETKPQPC